MISKKVYNTITMFQDKKIQFRDSGVFIQSDKDGNLRVSADGGTGADINFDGGVKTGGLTVGYVMADNSDYTALVDDYFIVADTNTSALTITLPTAADNAGKMYIVHDEGGNAATNNITIATEGSETINGSSTITLSSNDGTERLYNNGTNWFTW